jgi:ABC-type transport system substrate-binding protein
MVRSLINRMPLMASLIAGLGMGLIVATGLAPSDTRAARHVVKEGGTLMIGAIEFNFIDPALATPPDAFNPYPLAVWPMEDATCALLLRYPVGPPPVRYNLVPEVAAGYPAVSRDGKTYTFTIRKGYRFSTGAAVTSGSYAAAINRDLNPVMRSPAAPYLQDVVGADAVQRGAAQTASGVKVAGSRLIIKLTRRASDFPARMTMPYFCPVPKDLPIDDPEGVGAPLPGSGRYYIAEFVRGSRVVLERNPYYHGPRAHHFDRLVVQIEDTRSTITQKVEAGELDVDLTSPNPMLSELAAKYGVNKTQFWSIRGPDMFLLVMNTSQPLFKNNRRLRRAVNFAIDRSALRDVAAGQVGGSVTDDYLPPGMPGYVDGHLYPLEHPNLAKAQALAHGHTRSGKATLILCDTVACPLQAQIIQANLKQIGIDVEIKLFPFAVEQAKIATKGEPWDLTVERHEVNYMDPSQFIDVMLDGRTIKPTGNTNRAYFNSSHYNRLIEQAGKLSGGGRYHAYGKLAVDIAAQAAPLAAFNGRNNKLFVSRHVGCVQATAHSGFDLAGLCLK